MLLKLLSTNLGDMERNSRMENLVEFKRAYGASIEALRRCFGRFYPDMSEERKSDLLFTFLPFVYGIYPYAVVTDKQREAMEKAGIPYRYLSIYDLAFMGLQNILEA